MIELFVALSCQRAAKMSAENGKLVALRAALFHSVPAHVHELRRQASKLKDENNELMSLAYSQTKKQKVSSWKNQLDCATRLIAGAKNQAAACSMYWMRLTAKEEEWPLRNTKLQKKDRSSSRGGTLREMP